MATIAERISLAMDIRNLKQTDLVEKTGINKGALSSYIAGRYEPKQRNIYKLAQALNVSEAWLMGLDVPMEKKYENNTSVSTTTVPTLRPDESALLALYNQLNEEGMEKATDYLDVLLSSSKYKNYAGMDSSEVEDSIVLKYEPSLQKVVNDHLKLRKEYLATNKDCVSTKNKKPV